jgi:DNA (cytosine-5)-methyltransferase 1
VFVVGHLGDWKPAAKVLFESESLSGDIKQSRKTGKEITRCSLPSLASGKPAVGTLMANAGTKLWLGNQEAFSGDYRILQPSYSLQGAGSTSQNINGSGYKEEQSFTLNVTDVHGVAFGWQNSASQGMSVDTISPTLDKSKTPAVFCDTYNGTIQGDISATMTADMAGPTHSGPKVMQNMAVRRLTPVECERLQGFPDNYTNIPKAPDGNRYRALGNSMAVPVMKWIGERINEYERTNGRN